MPLSRTCQTVAPLARGAPLVDEPGAGPPLTLGTIPPAQPGPPAVLTEGPHATQQIALTIDDGFCADCIAQSIEFAQRSGIHITFNPNGVYNELWTPSIVAGVRQMVANQQVQIGNHTFNHWDVTKLSDTQITAQLEQNEEWIQQTYGITARPWWRPPYGYHNQRTDELAASIGYTNVLMWNGSYGDSTLLKPAELLNIARQYFHPGAIMLGHANYPTVTQVFPQIAEIIASRGLHPVTLDEMFGTSRSTGRSV